MSRKVCRDRTNFREKRHHAWILTKNRDKVLGLSQSRRKLGEEGPGTCKINNTVAGEGGERLWESQETQGNFENIVRVLQRKLEELHRTQVTNSQTWYQDSLCLHLKDGSGYKRTVRILV